MTRGRFGMPLAGLLSLLCVTGIRADIFHLRDGRRIQVESWHETESGYTYERFGGTVSIPKSLVARVERTGSPPANPAPPAPQAPSSPAPVASAPPPAPAPTPEQAGQIQALFETAERARAAERYDEAVQAYEVVLRIDPTHPDAGVYRTACYLWMNRYDEALSAAQDAMLYHPADPALLFLAGEIYYSQDRLSLALDSWERSLAIRDHPSVRERVEKVRRELNTEESYRSLPGGRFRLRFDGDGGSEDLAREILDFLEDRIGDLSLELDHFPSAPISVILYPDRQFHEVTLTEHNVQGLFDGKIRVPVGGETRLTAPLERVLEHELAHAIIDSKSGGNCPRWLHEGIAQRLSGETDLPFRRDLARQYLQLAGSGDWGPTLSYPAALSCVDYISSRDGFGAWLSILDRLGRGSGFADALWDTLRISEDDLYTAWGEDLQDGPSARR